MTEIRSETFAKAQNATAPRRLPLWLRGWSVEATMPEKAQIAALEGVLEPGCEIYLSSLPRIQLEDQLAAAVAVHEAGFVPVLHLAARKFVSEQQLADHLGAAGERAGVRKCLVIAGDLDVARGPFGSSLDLIDSSAFARSSVVEVGVGGYPEGHPFVGEESLAQSLATKVETARAAGMVPYVVSQFCFDSVRILHWLGWLRTFEPTLPVKLGVAGPIGAATLMKIALRCWVDVPSSGVRAVPQLVQKGAPDRIVGELDAGLKALHEQGALQLHLYTFGAIERTARWARAAQTTVELAYEM
ncbi:methylenetetrahydrofolate reductase (NADPH) [Breoghania corrubedonensis]|uniref:Methylenetetrahydrofolate reductase n=1 Tax=Breoghania corrubedonensis TaxID=665038 RepID=A0A2T5VBB1_9HYPH|nr:methylenetetrahydrofolate reductase [Breoghania corrubedonensis]PTW61046.1 methylenetetrahydrofolate reductase (NADPH) [Breoghania corrubedonensis]